MLPVDSVGFIKTCIRQNRIFWTYHVNMRLGVRSISRQIILDAVDSFEVIEEYPKDKYLPRLGIPLTQVRKDDTFGTWKKQV